MNKKIALIASLDTKMTETAFAAEEVRGTGCIPVLVDISTKTLEDRGADIGGEEILKRYGMGKAEFDALGKADSIETMCAALSAAMPGFYEEGRFDAAISIGGGQNARMAAAAMKALPFGVPKILASSLACGRRTMEQYVGDKDILVLHTVADISMLNETTKTVIRSVCHAAAGMVQYEKPLEADSRKKIAATMLGITTKGVEGALKRLPDEAFEKTVFHANGVGGRCMEGLIRAGKFDIVLDATLHEIACEVLGGYCTGADNRLMAAIETKTPMVIIPGAADMVDYFGDSDGSGFPADLDQRKKVFHNASVCHTKVFADEAVKVAEVIAERLNRAEAPVYLLLPDAGFCEAAAPGGPMYDPEADAAMINTLKMNITNPLVTIVDVPGNINDEACRKAAADAVLSLTAI